MQVVPYASGAAHMRLDGVTLANLEVLAAQDGSRDGTLLQTLDRCASHAGKRTLRAWLCRPLQDVDTIIQRQRAVRALGGAPAVCDELRGAMAAHPDLARCVSRGRITLLRVSSCPRRAHSLRGCVRAARQWPPAATLLALTRFLDAGTWTA